MNKAEDETYAMHLDISPFPRTPLKLSYILEGFPEFEMGLILSAPPARNVLLFPEISSCELLKKAKSK
jgi:hypothetical protein